MKMTKLFVNNNFSTLIIITYYLSLSNYFSFKKLIHFLWVVNALVYIEGCIQ